MARCGYLGTVWGINGGAAVGGPPLHYYATPEQKKKFLAPLLRGKQRHCLGVTEPASTFSKVGLSLCLPTHANQLFQSGPMWLASPRPQQGQRTESPT
jgi:hypothetical protein